MWAWVRFPSRTLPAFLFYGEEEEAFGIGGHIGRAMCDSQVTVGAAGRGGHEPAKSF